MALILWICVPREGLPLLGSWNTVLAKCYQDDCSSPRKTACCVVVAGLPSNPISDNQVKSGIRNVALLLCAV